MTYHRTRIRKLRAAGLLAVIAAALVAVLGHGAPAPSVASTQTPPPAAAEAETPRREGGLDPALLGAFHEAEAAAAVDGVDLQINSGWRSAEHQAELLREAIAKYGSEAQAARWVARPEVSVHVGGDAIDVGPTAGAAWLTENGAAYGLCRIYANEPWHFELRPSAAGAGCPSTYPDPTYDPRLNP
jgi:D-alanyl-D-alanine carboxypeptidase